MRPRRGPIAFARAVTRFAFAFARAVTLPARVAFAAACAVTLPARALAGIAFAAACAVSLPARALAGIAFAAALAVTLPARAEGPRPPDAPLAVAKRSIEPPPLPAEYREVDQDGIRFAYHPSTRERIRPLFERVGAIRATLAGLVGVDVLRRVEVRVAAVPAEMVSLSPGEVPASATSVAFFEPRLVVMSVVGPQSSAPLDVESTLTHALAHIALDEATGGADVPLWFHEGFAFNVAESGDLSSKRALVDAAVFGRFLTLDELPPAAGQGGLGDAQAGDFVRFLVASRDGRSMQPALPRVLRQVKDGEPFERAVVAALGAADRATVEARWSDDRARRYAFVPVLVVLLGAVGVVAAIWFAVGRSRRARIAASAALRARRERAASAPKAARPPAKIAAAARLAAGRGKDAAIHIPRDPEVPKVEHNGEWHTLH